MTPATPANKYPADRPGPRPVRPVDSRPELTRQEAAFGAGAEVHDETDDEPQVEPLPEVPGLFVFSTPVRSSSKVATDGTLKSVTLNPPNARQLIMHGSFNRAIKRTRRDEVSRQITVEEETVVDYGILSKHIAAMAGMSVLEVEGVSGYDMMRLSLKVQEMMYSLPS